MFSDQVRMKELVVIKERSEVKLYESEVEGTFALSG